MRKRALTATSPEGEYRIDRGRSDLQGNADMASEAMNKGHKVTLFKP